MRFTARGKEGRGSFAGSVNLTRRSLRSRHPLLNQERGRSVDVRFGAKGGLHWSAPFSEERRVLGAGFCLHQSDLHGDAGGAQAVEAGA